jgi:hypothetical protein
VSHCERREEYHCALKGRVNSTQCTALGINNVETNNLEDWTDAQEGCQTLHISKRTLQSPRTNGTLPYSKLGGKIYYKKSDLLKILSNNYTLYKINNYENK